MEIRLDSALDSAKALASFPNASGNDEGSVRALVPGTSKTPLTFPTVRECNEALSTFGDSAQLLRALRLFGKMRKSASLASSLRSSAAATKGGKGLSYFQPPAPTLVTYSTLMSRAVHLGKARVALRLWRLMSTQNEFFSNPHPDIPDFRVGLGLPIIPDVKAANILMNAYAKLGDYQSAQDLFQQMMSGDGNDVPRMEPNLVTHNTLIDACHRAGELGAALKALEGMRGVGIRPDARTYTSLISTVARRDSTASGARDPDLAFALLEDMVAEGISPNGMTYCALIDVCGRCGRSDLALKGLRMMLRQKAREGGQEEMEADQSGIAASTVRNRLQRTLSNEVGAWTAAINACGKSGRIDTAVQLFHRMQRFGLKPNAVTCGCLSDCLLRASPPRTGDVLGVLRYMKREGIEPSEVMYTSLMGSAEKLVKIESQQRWNSESAREEEDKEESSDDFDEEGESENGAGTRAVDLYTELMVALMQGGSFTSSSNMAPNQNSDGMGTGSRSIHPSSTGNRNHPSASKEYETKTLLLKVFLVFQEMKAAGATPDLACYNALLRACARAGDVHRARDTFERLKSDGLDPNDISWREMLRAASEARRSDLAERIWDEALEYRGRGDSSSTMEYCWFPDADAFEALMSSYVRSADSTSASRVKKRVLYQKAVLAYEDVRGSIYLEQMLREHRRAMLVVLRACVSLVLMGTNENYVEGDDMARQRQEEEAAAKAERAKEIATEIASLDCLQDTRTRDTRSMEALRVARRWRAERFD